MHEYYKGRKKKYIKKLRKQLDIASDELMTCFNTSYEQVLTEVIDCFVSDLLEDMPYIGIGNQHEIDLVDSCYWVAVFVVGKKHGLNVDIIGKIMTDAYEKMYSMPQFTGKVVKFLAKRKIFQTVLKIYTKSHKKAAGKYNYAWDYEYKEPDDAFSHKMVCTKCGFAKYMKDKGDLEFMPYICNLDYLVFGNMGLPLYRENVIGCGDECCTMFFKIDQEVQSIWPPHAIRGDGYK